jgi:hypothetical protein
VASGPGAAVASDSAGAGATEVQLIHAVTDEDAGVYDVRGLLGPSHQLSGLRYYRRPWGSMDFTLPRLNGGRATPMVTLRGHDVVLIKGRGVDAARGGPLSLIFLRSGVDSDYRELHLTLVHAENGGWEVFTREKSGKKRIDCISVERRSIPIVGKVGIGKVSVFFKHALVESFSTGDLQSY